MSTRRYEQRPRADTAEETPPNPRRGPTGPDLLLTCCGMDVDGAIEVLITMAEPMLLPPLA